MLGRLAPLFMVLLFSMLMNFATSGISSQPTQYKFSFQPNYNYPEKVTSYRLQQTYYVSPYAMRDFRNEIKLKQQTD